MKNILLTGGLGYIGSHTIVEILKNNNFNVIVIDNLSNSNIKTINNINKLIKSRDFTFYEGDILDKKILERIFLENDIHSVIHFAALKAVGESIEKPLLYYKNNISGTVQLLEVMEKHNVKNLIFSSSATVYGNQESPLNENNKTGDGITNPYGRSKYLIDQILKDLSGWNIFILRYFNPVGSHESGLIGDNPNGVPNNLMPFLLRVAKNNYYSENNSDYEYLKIFGNNYNTRDGTCIRDFIHVVDLANAHVCCLDKFKSGHTIINIGTGKGTTVMELINTFKSVLNIDIPYKILNKREGDIEQSYCLCDKAFNEINWMANKNINDICRDSWNFIQQ